MENYKNEIVQSRVGALGGSDASMLKQVAELGSVPKSAYKRLAVAKGLIEHQDVTTAAMRYGDFIEQSIYSCLNNSGDGEYLSNPCFVSKKFSKKNIKLLCHPDYVYVDHKNKVVRVYECKATKYSVLATKETYREQMYVEYMLAKEYAATLGEGYSVHLSLVHYDASDVDFDKVFEFNPNKVTVTGVFKEKNPRVFEIDLAMTIVNDFLETFDTYYDGDEVDASLLPQDVKKQFDTVTTILSEIKSRETEVALFKAKLYEFMRDNDVKSIKNDDWTISRVDPSESVTFDSKAFLGDYKKEHPVLHRKLVSKYSKKTKKSGYVTIKLKEKKEDNK